MSIEESVTHGAENEFAPAQQNKLQQTTKLKCFICRNNTMLINEDNDSTESDEFMNIIKMNSSWLHLSIVFR